jgi:uncharacterized membrane protein YheB (UPF0754 family)
VEGVQVLAVAAAAAWWKYATIPVIAGLIGWGTNWLAVRMTFWPLEFRGIPPFLGWQGIVPSRARKMASIAVDSSLAKIGTLTEIVTNMEPERIAKHILHTVEPRVPAMVDAVAEREYPRLWATTPQPLKEAVYDRCRNLLPKGVDGLVDEMTENIDQLLDLRLMVIDQMTAHKELLNEMFLTAGEKEFRFIINSGLYFGFALGLLQMGVQLVFPAWWVLPIAGLLVGYITNWLALTLIFEPVEPRKFGPVTVQGLFLKRQAEVATVFSHLTTREVLTIRHFVERMLTGPMSDRTRRLIDKHVRPMVDEAIGIARPAFQLAVGTRDYEQIKQDLSARALEMSLEPFDDPVFVESRAVLVEEQMRERMVAMTPDEFSQLLRPTVEEDEWKLIAVGAALGGLAGLAQTVFVFGATLL